MPDVRVLGTDDDAALRAFLEPRVTSSMFLLSNSRLAGLVDQGQTYHATYAGAFAGGELVGVAAHCWNGMVLVQAPGELVADETIGALVQHAVSRSGREISGFSGPADQVVRARRACAVTKATSLDEVEGLYALSLDELRVPEPLATRAVSCRVARSDEVALLATWRRAYRIETLGAADTPDVAELCWREIEELVGLARLWVLEAEGVVVAMSGFNARLPEIVQVGGVYTPPALRGRGYARCAVAGSLGDARNAGATRAILFTQSAAAARAYEAIGFQRVGEYALVLFDQSPQ